ncbi:hypothetical protein [Halomonas piscis]|uniref:hypothetical protein n=1 Tax=Halomonas piscis TaxID=3031727 RepID=UPI0028972E29|nr:hypothetical protein [Halomonas piscis]
MNAHQLSPKLDASDDARACYTRFLEEQPTRYHLTLTFTYGVHEKLCITMLNELLKQLNRSILKGRYRKHDEFIAGMAVKEPTFAKHTFHFHILISDVEMKLPDRERLTSLLEKKRESVNRMYAGRNNIDKIELQEYYEGNADRSLEKYLTKQFERAGLTFQQKMDSFCPLCHSGVSFG